MRLFAFFIFIFIFCSVHGQSANTIHVKYNFQHVRDLNKSKEPFKGDYILTIKNRESRFVPYFLYEDTHKKIGQNNMTASSSGSRTVNGMPVLVISNSGTVVTEEINKNFAKKQMECDARILSKYFYTLGTLPQIEWKLTDQSKKILNYTCQKAETSYLGRKYIAWFSKDLPIADGPWKFYGLPGLILEAKDENGEVVFEATEIFRNDDMSINSLIHNDNSIEISKKEYDDLKRKFEENPEAVARGFYPNRKVGIRNIQNTDNKSIKMIEKYNPVEF